MSAVTTGSTNSTQRLNFSIISVVIICWLAIIFEGYDLTVYGTIVPALLHYKAWNINAVQAGAIQSYAIIGMLFGALIIGALNDVFGRKRMLITCALIFSLSMGVCAIAPTPLVFSLFRFIGGLGLGGIIPTTTALTIEYAPARWRTFTYTIMFTGYSLGGILASGLAIPIIPAAGWQAMFWIGVLPLVIVVIPAVFFLPESLAFLLAKGRRTEAERIAQRFGISLAAVPASPAERTGASSRRTSSFATLFTPQYIAPTILFAIATFFTLFMIFGLGTWLPQIMTRAGYSLGSALTFLLVLNLGNVIGNVIAGRLADQFGIKRVAIIIYLLGAVSIAALSIKLPFLATYVLLFFAGNGSIGTQNLVNAYVAQYYPVESRGTASGWALGVGRFGGILGPVIGGYLQFLHVGVQSTFIIFAVPGVLAATAILLVRNHRAADLADVSTLTAEGIALESSDGARIPPVMNAAETSKSTLTTQVAGDELSPKEL